jgi:hypothetical protein
VSDALDDAGYGGPCYDLIWGRGVVNAQAYHHDGVRASLEMNGIAQFEAIPTQAPRVGPILDFWIHDIPTHTYVHQIEQLVCQVATEGE